MFKKFALISLFLLMFTCQIQAETAPKVQIKHSAPQSTALAAPGSELLLSPVVQGTKDLNLTMLANVVLDGRLISQPLKMRLDDATNLVFDLRTRAPLSEISYQFFLISGDKLVSQSERYVVKRSCRSTIEPALKSISNDLKPDQRVRATLKNVTTLKQDIENYKRSLIALNRIQEQVNE